MKRRPRNPERVAARYLAASLGLITFDPRVPLLRPGWPAARLEVWRIHVTERGRAERCSPLWQSLTDQFDAGEYGFTPPGARLFDHCPASPFGETWHRYRRGLAAYAKGRTPAPSCRLEHPPTELEARELLDLADELAGQYRDRLDRVAHRRRFAPSEVKGHTPKGPR